MKHDLPLKDYLTVMRNHRLRMEAIDKQFESVDRMIIIGTGMMFLAIIIGFIAEGIKLIW